MIATMAKRRGKPNYGLAAFVVFVRRLFELNVDRRAWVGLGWWLGRQLSG
jgi:hypothetical protein